MKRFMLATTAVLALSAPTFAQTSAEATVTAAMVGYGYDASVVEGLTDEQIALLYSAITSEDQTQINAAIATLELPVDQAVNGLVDTPLEDDTVTVVRQILDQNGFGPGTVKLLSDTEIAELYQAATSEDQTLINQVIASFDFQMDADGNMLPTTSATARTLTELEVRGLTEADIAKIDEAEMNAIFLALISDDEAEINAAITSAIN